MVGQGDELSARRGCRRGTDVLVVVAGSVAATCSGTEGSDRDGSPSEGWVTAGAQWSADPAPSSTVSVLAATSGVSESPQSSESSEASSQDASL